MQTHYLADSCSEEDEDDTILVEQHLEPEQKEYEFPSRALLVELAAVLDTHAKDDTMFDETSFTTMGDNDDDDAFDEYVGSIVSSIQQKQRRHHSPSVILSSSSTSSRWSLVDDSRLSPLQLPPRDDDHDTVLQHRQRSMDQTGKEMQNHLPRPVHPSFFLCQEDDNDDSDIHPDDVDHHWDRCK
ncbi:hypothetical protein BX666DRAFT_518717 [Dichotomocladium elegans]|nr:hypothetical protein BX666DRAFT_518717 [Dichotomocladium elegans]